MLLYLSEDEFFKAIDLKYRPPYEREFYNLLTQIFDRVRIIKELKRKTPDFESDYNTLPWYFEIKEVNPSISDETIIRTSSDWKIIFDEEVGALAKAITSNMPSILKKFKDLTGTCILIIYTNLPLQYDEGKEVEFSCDLKKLAGYAKRVGCLGEDEYYKYTLVDVSLPTEVIPRAVKCQDPLDAILIIGIGKYGLILKNGFKYRDILKKLGELATIDRLKKRQTLAKDS